MLVLHKERKDLTHCLLCKTPDHDNGPLTPAREIGEETQSTCP
jgi:hypothetical protein